MACSRVSFIFILIFTLPVFFLQSLSFSSSDFNNNKKILTNFSTHTLLGCYAASSGNLLPTFRDNVSVPSSNSTMKQLYWTSWRLKTGPIRCPETSAKDYHSTLPNTPEERTSHQHRGGNLKSRLVDAFQNQPLCKYVQKFCSSYTPTDGRTDKHGSVKRLICETLFLYMLRGHCFCLCGRPQYFN
jgi:hypothetical protein